MYLKFCNSPLLAAYHATLKAILNRYLAAQVRRHFEATHPIMGHMQCTSAFASSICHLAEREAWLNIYGPASISQFPAHYPPFTGHPVPVVCLRQGIMQFVIGVAFVVPGPVALN